MLSLSMFSSLLYSKDKRSWLPVVLLRQRFFTVPDWAVSHWREWTWKNCLPQSHCWNKNYLHWLQDVIAVENRLIVFLQHFLPPPLLFLSCLPSILWPRCSLLYIQYLPLFSLNVLYTLNLRQSVLTGIFALLSGKHIYPFCSLPTAFFFLCTGASQPAASFPLLQQSKKLMANRLGAWLDSAEHLPLGYSWWLLPRSPEHGPVSLSVVRVAGRVGIESAKQPGIFHSCIFLPVK